MGNDPFAYEIDDDIHHYSKKIVWTKSRLGTMFDGQVGIRFLEKLQLVGLSNARLCYYGDRITNVLKEFEKLKVIPADATKQHCETVLSEFISRDYKGETKIAYALALQRLVHFAKTGEIGDKKSGYVQEVQWISPSRYRDKNGSVHRKDLLTLDEFLALVSKTTNKRDRAMLWVLYEGAFRPGELLNIRVGGIDFQDEYVLVSTYGKTAQKSVALVVSFRPLLEWLGEHPLRDDPNAPLWYSPWKGSKTKQISYDYLRQLVIKCAEKAQIKKRVWNYLLRHTQLTELAKKLSDQTLRVYGNWSPGTKMTARYAHLSGRDAQNAILHLHGITSGTNNDSIARLKECPRCRHQNEPDKQRCAKCGYIIDERLLAKSSMTQQHDLAEMRKQLEHVKTLENKIDLLFDEILKKTPSQAWT